MNTSMKKKIGATGILLFLGLTIVFQLAYFIWLRRMISNVGVFYSNLDGSPNGRTPREVVDHFVCCMGLVHYFLCGYLYSIKRHFAERSLNGKNGKIKRWVGMEIFCQLGIFFSYLLVWIDNRILLYYINERIRHWSVGGSTTVLYKFLCKKEIISKEYTWVEQYGDIFDFSTIIAPILLMLLIYGIHCVFSLVQFKRNNCLNMIWAVWSVVSFITIVLLIKWNFQPTSFGRWWYWYQENFGYFW